MMSLKATDFKSHFSLIHSNWGGHNDIKWVSITHIASLQPLKAFLQRKSQDTDIIILHN